MAPRRICFKGSEEESLAKLALAKVGDRQEKKKTVKKINKRGEIA
jgi:hypothetical protein